MKRILKENMMRFGTKNLNELDQIKDTTHVIIDRTKCIFVVSTRSNDNTLRFIPDNATHDYLANVSPGKVLDTLQIVCERGTGIKFSPVYNDVGAGYAFNIDMYSVADKIKNHKDTN